MLSLYLFYKQVVIKRSVVNLSTNKIIQMLLFCIVLSHYYLVHVKTKFWDIILIVIVVVIIPIALMMGVVSTHLNCLGLQDSTQFLWGLYAKPRNLNLLGEKEEKSSGPGVHCLDHSATYLLLKFKCIYHYY